MLILAAANEVNSASRHDKGGLTDISGPGSPSPRLSDDPRSDCAIRFLGR